MPGLWVHLKDNPDFFQDFNPGTGEYFERTLYDEGHREQGKVSGALAVQNRGERTASGQPRSSLLSATITFTGG